MTADLILIGGSAGSLQVIIEILPQLKKDVQQAVVIVFHRKAHPNSQILIDLLNTKSALPVKEVEDKEKIQAGMIYIAPADYHLFLEKDHSFSLDISEKVNYSRPSIDLTFITAADVYKDKIIAILLSGANSDGVNGLKVIKKHGGHCIAQEPSSSLVSYMPSQAILKNAVEYIATPSEIVKIINESSISSLQ